MTCHFSLHSCGGTREVMSFNASRSTTFLVWFAMITEVSILARIYDSDTFKTSQGYQDQGRIFEVSVKNRCLEPICLPVGLLW